MEIEGPVRSARNHPRCSLPVACFAWKANIEMILTHPNAPVSDSAPAYPPSAVMMPWCFVSDLADLFRHPYISSLYKSHLSGSVSIATPNASRRHQSPLIHNPPKSFHYRSIEKRQGMYILTSLARASLVPFLVAGAYRHFCLLP